MASPSSRDPYNTIIRAVTDATSPFALSRASISDLADQVATHLHTTHNPTHGDQPTDDHVSAASELALDLAFSNPELRKEMNFSHALDHVR